VELIHYGPLWWMLGVFVLVAALRYTLVDRPRLMLLSSVACRALAVILLAVVLARPFMLRSSQRLHVVFLVDVSQSVNLDDAGKALEKIDQAIEELDRRDTWSLFALADGLRSVESTEAFRKMLTEWQEGLADEKFRSATRLADGLRTARLSFPSDAARRIVVFSDGRPTGGDLSETFEVLADEKTDLRFASIEGITDPEAAVLSLSASKSNAYEDEVIRFGAGLASNVKTSASLRLIQRGVVVAKQDVRLQPEQTSRAVFDVPMKVSGHSVWTAELVPREDSFAINNAAGCTVNVQGRPRVLVLHQKHRRMRNFVRAMEKQGFMIDLRSPKGLPRELDELLAFDAVMLADMPATEMSTRQMLMLRRYVADFGGGLMMLGSENSFGLGGYYKTPVEQVLPLVSRFEKEKEKPSMAMVLVIDKSGSMDGMPIALARQAAKASVELLSGQDQAGVVAFDSKPYVVCEVRSARDTAGIAASIDRVGAGGGTFMYSGMAAARDMLRDASAKIKHMIVLGDGQTQPADHDGLVAELVDMGVTVSTVALGPNADQNLMAHIASSGNGRYYVTMDPSTVPQIFTRETMQATRSAIKEDLYSCVQVGDHPLLEGYENTELPYIFGYVMTQPKPTSEVVLATASGDPLLASSRYGLGMGMAYTSDLTERWGGEWLSWEDCGSFWAQVLRSLARDECTPGFQKKHRQIFVRNFR